MAISVWINISPTPPLDDEECDDCEEILEVLEQIDGEADLFGIDFVKIASDEAMEKYEIINIPSLVYFRWESSKNRPWPH